MKSILLVLLTLATVPAMSIETLKYDILEKDNKVEIRRYKEYIAASVSFDSREEFDRKAFRTLADYIFGNNINMTSPVLTRGEKIGMTSPVLSQEKETRWTMTFSMPSRYTLESLPRPNNEKIKIKLVDEAVMATIRFSGFMSDSNYKKNESKLKGWLDSKSIEYHSNTIRAGYNPPWTLPFFRRNEVLIYLK